MLDKTNHSRGSTVLQLSELFLSFGFASALRNGETQLTNTSCRDVCSSFYRLIGTDKLAKVVETSQQTSSDDSTLTWQEVTQWVTAYMIVVVRAIERLHLSIDEARRLILVHDHGTETRLIA